MDRRVGRAAWLAASVSVVAMLGCGDATLSATGGDASGAPGSGGSGGGNGGRAGGGVPSGPPDASGCTDTCNGGRPDLAPYCAGSSITHVGNKGTVMTVTFGDPDGDGPEGGTYTCGQYANGDWWIVGKGSPVSVTVDATTPAWNGETHGHMDNPKVRGENSMDCRMFGCTDTPKPLPHRYVVDDHDVTFINYAGRPTMDPDSITPCADSGPRGCGQMTTMTAFVRTIPDSDGDGSTADEFRPGYAGDDKPGPFNIDALFDARVAAFPRLDQTPVPTASEWTFAKIKDYYRFSDMDHLTGWAPWQLMGQDNKPYFIPGCVGCQRADYGHTMGNTNPASILRLTLDDFSWEEGADSRQALINIVQQGIDIYSAGSATGKQWRWPGNGHRSDNSGGHHHGRKVLAVFAAHLLDDPTMQAWVRAGHFYEDKEIFRGSNGVVYYGIDDEPGTDGTCPATQSHVSQTTRGQCKISDAPLQDAGCPDGVSQYALRSSNFAPYQAQVVTVLGLEALWNDDAYLEYARTWKEGGRAPGHERYMWCGPDGNNPSRSNTQTVGPQFENDFGNEMWDAYKDVSP